MPFLRDYILSLNYFDIIMLVLGYLIRTFKYVQWAKNGKYSNNCLYEWLHDSITSKAKIIINVFFKKIPSHALLRYKNIFKNVDFSL